MLSAPSNDGRFGLGDDFGCVTELAADKVTPDFKGVGELYPTSEEDLAGLITGDNFTFCEWELAPDAEIVDFKGVNGLSRPP